MRGELRREEGGGEEEELKEGEQIREDVEEEEEKNGRHTDYWRAHLHNYSFPLLHQPPLPTLPPPYTHTHLS